MTIRVPEMNDPRSTSASSALSLDKLLRQFEIAEANLAKLRKHCDTLGEIERGSGPHPSGVTNKECIRRIYSVWEALPKIDGWKPDINIYDYNEQQLMRLDAQEVGFADAFLATENEINGAFETIDEYAFRLKRKRLDATRRRVRELVDAVNRAIASFRSESDDDAARFKSESAGMLETVKQIDALLGDSFTRPDRWIDLRRHLAFGEACDLRDIIKHDWPSVCRFLTERLYADDEPIASEITDFGAVVVDVSRTPLTTRLAWENLAADEFERLIFNLISGAAGYQTLQWLTRTNAPDRGRDISAYRVHEDALAGTLRQRVIIQCKHWQTSSVAVDDVALLREQMKLWEPPTVDCVVIATSGRFTSDAVAYIEKHNQSGQAPRIEMWAESHLEMLLARRPALIAEFRLKE